MTMLNDDRKEKGERRRAGDGEFMCKGWRNGMDEKGKGGKGKAPKV